MIKEQENRKKLSPGRRMFIVINIIVLTLVALTCILPFVYLVAVSFSDKVYVEAGRVSFWPIGFNTLAYQYLITKRAFWNAFLVSIKRTILGTLINLTIIFLTAYPLSKSNYRLCFRNIYVWFFFITMLISGGMIPTYVLVNSLGLRDTIWALVLPGALPIFNLVLMINFFQEIPSDLEDAAMIDGAGRVRTLVSIYIPLSKPAVATISLFCMVNHWNAWFDGVIYMRTASKVPLQTYLRSIILKMDMTEMTGDDYSLLQLLSNPTVRAAQIIVAVIPILMVYPFLQKYFVKGITLGGVKG